MLTPVCPRVTALVCLVLGLLVGGVSLTAALRADSGLAVTRTSVDGIPVTWMEPADGVPDGAQLPAVIVVHGYAASGELMTPLARSIARAGYAVAVPDLPGHGANPDPLPSASDALGLAVRALIPWVQAQPGIDATHIALVGHSMGAGAVVRAAAVDERVRATVAISLPSAVAEGRAADLLLLVGANEPVGFRDALMRQLELYAPGGVQGTTYGSPADGTAVRAQTIPGVEHLTIVWVQGTANATVAWIGAAVGGPEQAAAIDAAWLWLIGMLVAAILLAVPLAALVYRVTGASGVPAWPRGVRVRWAMPVAVAGAVAAAVVAWLAQPLTEAVPLAVGGYLAVWFAVAGLVMGAAALWLRHRAGAPLVWASRQVVAGVVLASFMTVCLIVASRLTWAEAAFVGVRPLMALLLLVCFGAYCLGDEMLVARTRGWARAGLVAFNRLVAVVVLLAAVPLLGAPRVLTLQVPLMVLLFAVLAGVAAVVRQRTADPIGPALVQAVPIAAIVAASFPLV